jgi:peptide-methionine (R)-S-oxide reductase
MINVFKLPVLAIAFSLFACTAEPPAQPVSAGGPSGVVMPRESKTATTQNVTTHTSAKPTEKTPMTDIANRTDAEWKKILTPEQYHILREKGTERAFSGEYDELFEPGSYACAACGTELFTSQHKFNSGCGWPAFYAAAAGDRVKLTSDNSHGMRRVEVTCAKCDSHLGHVFDGETHVIDGVQKKVSRYCINSVSLKFTPKK